MTTKSILTALFALGLGCGSAQAQPLSVDFGTVTGVEPIDLAKVGDDKSKLAMGGGGLLGGVVGYTFGKGSSKGKKVRGVLIGAAVGAFIGKEATKDAGKGTAYRYTVELNSGERVNISTEQDRIDVDDCVTVERGEAANIRRVSQLYCQDKAAEPTEDHMAVAEKCLAAKAAISDAATDEAISAAVDKARKLCED